MDECKFSSILSRGPWLNSCFPEQIKCFFSSSKLMFLISWNVVRSNLGPGIIRISFSQVFRKPCLQLPHNNSCSILRKPCLQLPHNNSCYILRKPCLQLPHSNSCSILRKPCFSSSLHRTPFQLQGTLLPPSPLQHHSVFLKPCLLHSFLREPCFIFPLINLSPYSWDPASIIPL